LRKVVIACFMLCLIVFSLIEVGRSVPSNGSINVPYSANAPVIDGQWTIIGEWSDASKTSIDNNVVTGYIGMKQDRISLFVLLDIVSDRTNDSFDFFGVCIDTKDDGGNPSSDDYFFYRTMNIMPTSFKQGDSKDNWTYIDTLPAGLKIQSGFTAMLDAYEPNYSHALCEFQIPLSYLGKENTYGFYAFAYDSSTGKIVQYPQSSEGTHYEFAAYNFVPSSPSSWGDVNLELSSSPSPSVPEISPSIMVITLAFALTFIIWFKKSRKHSFLENKLENNF
jgi:hypothetical protein